MGTMCDVSVYRACDFPMHTAARVGDHTELLRMLYSGFHANQTNFDSATPLHEACLAGNVECVRILLKAGAQVNARNIDGGTPLCDASSFGCMECVKLLLENGADVNPQLNFTTALHEAVLRDKWQVVQMLVAAGAHLNSNDLHFGTPLHAASYKGYHRSSKVLLQAGCNVNAAKMHQTPLHVAAARSKTLVVSLLLEYGADVYRRNNHNKLASDLAPPGSQVQSLIINFQKFPRKLSEICRLVIRRRTLGRRKTCPDLLMREKLLPLPTLLLQYIYSTCCDI